MAQTFDSSFDLEQAVSIEQYLDEHNISIEEDAFYLKEDMNGKYGQFTALGLRNGEPITQNSGFSFFGLSQKLRDAGEVLNEEFLRKNFKKIRLVEDENDTTCGVIFLSAGLKSFADLLAEE